jgi:hypothetical protein
VTGKPETSLRTVLGLALATLATGCLVAVVFGDFRSEDEQAVEATVQTFLDAIGDDGETACLQLSLKAQTSLRRREDEKSCERAAESTATEKEPLLDFGAIRFSGPENERARVPSAHPNERIEDLVGDDLEGLRDDLETYLGDDAALDYVLGRPPIFLEKADDRWRITNLDWYF